MRAAFPGKSSIFKDHLLLCPVRARAVMWLRECGFVRSLFLVLGSVSLRGSHVGRAVLIGSICLGSFSDWKTNVLEVLSACSVDEICVCVSLT